MLLFFRGRMEYTIDEDLSILKFLIQQNLYDKVGGNTAWKIVHKVNLNNNHFEVSHLLMVAFIITCMYYFRNFQITRTNLYKHDFDALFSPTSINTKD